MTAPARRVVILGSTGSIGRQALDVISNLPDRLQVVGLGAGTDADGVAEQAKANRVQRTALGEEAAVELAAMEEADVVLNAIVGAAGLHASLAALRAGKTLALANKESLVAAGELCAAAADAGGGRIVPVDSEHAALSQCIAGRRDEVRRIVITASGGPFRRREDLSGVTKDEALAHPTWSMGPKITIDSATLMNKGLEVIEAHYLFDFDFDALDVIVHPQSVVHGIVELQDGSMLMHAAVPDMRVPIQWALLENGPSAAATYESLDLAAIRSLEFEELDAARFPAVGLAYDAGRAGRSYPAALNAANEVAVHAFLEERLAFVDIVPVVAEVLDGHEPLHVTTVEAVFEADAAARAAAAKLIERRALAGAGGRS